MNIDLLAIFAEWQTLVAARRPQAAMVYQQETTYKKEFYFGQAADNSQKLQGLAATYTEDIHQQTVSLFLGFFVNGKKRGYGVHKNEKGETTLAYWQNNTSVGEFISKKPSIDVIYVGQQLKGVAHGQGNTFYTLHKNIYIGSYSNGMRQGYGLFYFTNGDFYAGYWENGYKEGRGRYQFSDGSYYEGEFKQGNFCGYGENFTSGGSYYKGGFQKDARHGEGILFHSGGSLFAGTWADNYLTANSIYIYETGSVHIGEFAQSSFNGRGHLYHLNYMTAANYRQDMKTGFGTYYYSDGSRYEGDYQHDKQHGWGVFYYTNGDYYEGWFEQGEFCGYGQYFYRSGQEYVGNWQHGNRQGWGRTTYTNGEYFEGEFQQGEKHGTGFYYYQNGTKNFGGSWENDVLVYSC